MYTCHAEDARGGFYIRSIDHGGVTYRKCYNHRSRSKVVSHPTLYNLALNKVMITISFSNKRARLFTAPVNIGSEL